MVGARIGSRRRLRAPPACAVSARNSRRSSQPTPHASLLIPPAGLFHPTLDNVLPVRLGWHMVHGACSVPPSAGTTKANGP